ncbi:PucR family transcriptional regulator ligand-binding domain-containing protein [Bacillus tianshenii]|nr:PucR family transcriptional regulator ligand-binding domain-containing protein [Bacillus tianshenii]
MMAITIEDMLKLPLLKEADYVAGRKGQKKIVRWVTILELLDDIEQLEEGELLLTTAFDLHSSSNLKSNLIPHLASQKLSGIIIQTGYYLEKIPEEMIEAANDYSFPIIEIPKNVTFSEITKGIHKNIINKQFEEIHYSEQIYRKLTNIAINNEGLEPIAKAVRDLINGQLTFFDINLNKLCVSKASFSLPEDFSQNLLSEHKKKESQDLFELTKLSFDNDFHAIITPIMAKGNIYGYIVGIKKVPFNNFEEIAIQHSSTIGALEFIKLATLEAKDNQLRSDFLELLLTGNYTDEITIHSKSEALGYKLDANDTCVGIIKIDTYENIDYKERNKLESQLQQTILKHLQDHAIETLFKCLNGQFILLMTNYYPDRSDISLILAKLSEHIKQKYDLTLSIGIGKYYNNINEYRFSFKEAQEALFIIESVWKKNKLLHYKDLGLYKLLLPLLQNKELIQEYHHKILKDILNNEELLETLRIYLEDMKMNNAAEKLFIHRHTLKYRIKKIEKLTDRKIHNFKDRIELELALIIHNMLYNE